MSRFERQANMIRPPTALRPGRADGPCAAPESAGAPTRKTKLVKITEGFSVRWTESEPNRIETEELVQLSNLVELFNLVPAWPSRACVGTRREVV